MAVLPASLLLRRRNYQIDRSLRFNDDDSAYLSRTFGTPTNRYIMTFSAWVKRGNIGSSVVMFGSASGTFPCITFGVNANNVDSVSLTDNAPNSDLSTSAVCRDVAAWYHIVVAIDLTQSTAANRVHIYVNGVEGTYSDTSYPAQNLAWTLNTAVAHGIGRYGGASNYFDGYMAEVHFIDGTALTPTSFGEFDTNGIWRPIEVSGLTYGTNGFYLSFADNSSTTTLGYDDAGSNDWTLNNFSVTAGVGNDSLEDTPTNNFCTMSAISKTSAAAVLANGCLDCTNSTLTAYPAYGGGVYVSSGKFYWEVSIAGSGTFNGTIGFSPQNTFSTISQQYLGAIGYTSDTGAITIGTGSGSTTLSTGTSFTYGDVVAVALNMDDGTATFYKNNAAQGSVVTSLSGFYAPALNINYYTAGVFSHNFGQRAFAYTPPTGFVALCTANLPTPDIADPGSYMNAVLYTGTGSSLGVTGAGFQPDLVWIKSRSAATDHALYDAVRGVQKQIESNSTTDETTETTGLTAFGSDGFTVGALAQVNTNTATYVAWCWKEGVTPGFDIVTYTGNGSNRTISHNLGAVPKLIIIKARTTAGTDQGWPVYQAANTAAPETDYLLLNSTAATADDNTLWNDTAPTTTVFSVGTNALVNALNDTYVAYLWSEVEGFSKFGSYTGNGSADGPFVWCNLQPRYVAIKRTDTTGDWFIWDVARDTYNVATKELLANSSAAEAGTADLDILSNGFKLRSTTAGFNASAGTYIFMAFAEQPFINARAR